MSAAALLGLAWAGWSAFLLRPRRLDRLQPLLSAEMSARARDSAGKSSREGRAIDVIDLFGERILRAIGRSNPEQHARAAGLAAAGALAGLATWPSAAPVLGAVGWLAPGHLTKRAERRRQQAIEADLPEVVDLLLVAVCAGLTVHLALRAVAARAVGPLGPPLRRVVDEVTAGRRVADALDGLPASAGESVRPLVAALADSDRYGSPLGPSLERLAAEVRRSRERRAEEAARRVPVRMLFPLVLCVLPAFALLTVAPLIAGAVQSLRL